MDAQLEVAVIGAGAVGLACAAELAERGREVIVIDRQGGPGRETTSRNSGVIHAGLYYAPGSRKARSCVRGRDLLYERCERIGIPHRRTGKLVVATSEEELEVLAALRARAQDNGAGLLEQLDAAQARQREPRVEALGALWSPLSGIVDVHALTASYAAQAGAGGAMFAYRTSVEAIERQADGTLSVWTRGPAGERQRVSARFVVNAAGLGSDAVAERAGLDVDALGWRLRYCKGDYFRLSSRLGRICRGLVYPVPAHAGLGVHVTVDLANELRAGPDAEYVPRPTYDVDETKRAAFGRALRRYLPEVRDDDLSPDYAGVRPKLYGPREPVRDFVLEEQPTGLIHLVGIESPGVTASLALAEEVAAVVERRA